MRGFARVEVSGGLRRWKAIYVVPQILVRWGTSRKDILTLGHSTAYIYLGSRCLGVAASNLIIPTVFLETYAVFAARMTADSLQAQLYCILLRGHRKNNSVLEETDWSDVLDGGDRGNGASETDGTDGATEMGAREESGEGEEREPNYSVWDLLDENSELPTFLGSFQSGGKLPEK